MGTLDTLGSSGEVVVDNGDLDPTDREALLAFAAGPAAFVENPFAAQAPRLGILSAATDVSSLVSALYGDHWLLGFQFEPELGALDLSAAYPWYWQCQEAGGTAWSTVVTEATGAAKKPTPARLTNVGVRPFTVSVADPCLSTTGMFGRDGEARARRALESNLSRIAAAELWTGTRATSAGFPNDFLLRAPTALNGGAATALVNALAELEQGYADRDNRPGFIHCQPRVAQQWLAAFACEPAPSGRYLTTALGNIVVPDAGYPGSGTGVGAGTKATSWAYMTGPVAYARTATRILGATEAERVDFRNTQDRVVRAECDLAVFWDSKVNVSIKIDHTVAIG